MIVVQSIAELDVPRRGVVGLVPTMGALHAGHEALFAAARAESDVLVASLFVNAAQFGDTKDLAAYPRDLEHDAAIAKAAGVEARPDERLAPGATAEGVKAAATGRGEAVVVVGHQPDCGRIAAALTGGEEPAFAPAAMLAFELT